MLQVRNRSEGFCLSKELHSQFRAKDDQLKKCNNNNVNFVTDSYAVQKPDFQCCL